MSRRQKFAPNAGIAIGPILFVIAMLAVLGAVFASGGSDFQLAASADRISSNIATQANLIRNTISTCTLQYDMGVAAGSIAPISPSDAAGKYPVSAAEGTEVKDLNCDATANGATPENLWNNSSSNIMLPQPTRGFEKWKYINAGESGGRCIWTKPDTAVHASPKDNLSIKTGLQRAAARFNATTKIENADDLKYEVVYDPESESQKFIVWIRTPSSAISASEYCKP